VWAGGLYGSLYHYDGTTFSKVWLDSTVSFARITGFSSSNIYATASRIVDFVSPLDSEKVLLYHYDGHEWSIIDSCLVTSPSTPYTFDYRLWASPQGKLYSSGYGLFRRNYTGWEKLFDSTWPINVFGSSESNMYTVSEIGEVKHWNGSNWIHVSQIEESGKLLIGGWTNNIETFIFGYDGYKTFIIHGK
jgi:hypothetical protein